MELITIFIERRPQNVAPFWIILHAESEGVGGKPVFLHSGLDGLFELIFFLPPHSLMQNGTKNGDISSVRYCLADINVGAAPKLLVYGENIHFPVENCFRGGIAVVVLVNSGHDTILFKVIGFII